MCRQTSCIQHSAFIHLLLYRLLVFARSTYGRYSTSVPSDGAIVPSYSNDITNKWMVMNFGATVPFSRGARSFAGKYPHTFIMYVVRYSSEYVSSSSIYTHISRTYMLVVAYTHTDRQHGIGRPSYIFVSRKVY